MTERRLAPSRLAGLCRCRQCQLGASWKLKKLKAGGAPPVPPQGLQHSLVPVSSSLQAHLGTGAGQGAGAGSPVFPLSSSKTCRHHLTLTKPHICISNACSLMLFCLQMILEMYRQLNYLLIKSQGY